MDGLPLSLLPVDALPVDALARQHTLGAAIGCVGTGLHSGRRVRLMLRPAPANHGIVFRRTDLGRDIPARFGPRFGRRIVAHRLRRGLLRRRAAPAGAPQPAAPEAMRHDPAAEPRPEPRPSVHPVGGEDMGLEIPTFLRRQSS